MKQCVQRLICPTALLFLLANGAQVGRAQQTSDPSAATPHARSEMQKLFRAFVGRWTVHERFERNEFSPGGGSRTGTARFTVGSGGTSLVEDYHSDGSAGKLDFLAIIWFDPGTRSYHVFTCASGRDACAVRGTAHWDGATFVNDYEEPLNGMPTKLQDVFSNMTPTSIKLVAGIPGEDPALRPLITTRYQRAGE
jgi:hypothetical protein